MASPNEPPLSKRRLGRRRLPPLEPGPALQFVIASHPDQFRAGKTMRHVRSHVMYKHRTERKTTTNERTTTEPQSVSACASACASSTSSPASISQGTSISEGDYLTPPQQSRPRSSTWTVNYPQDMSQNPYPSTLRALIYRILSSTQVEYARSAPPIFEDAPAFPFPGFYDTHGDPLYGLREQYIEICGFFSIDKEWMRAICADQLSLLSHASISSVYQDISDGIWQDSSTTVQVKTHTLSAMAGHLESNDATILSILHLLLSEVGGDESAFLVHYQGLQGLVTRRGGLSQLANRLAVYVTL
ncbi:hypothetical protein OPT61_g10053 [Boeremia exigua]|uniref:Uncharacterized protein n=1 Tax=Boeremia exigua TaxID=749465 RepID=A0ACC2HSA9_9PLEO|nr:hypothetical protein OPT61_g10053 [Boeremia exigua]